MTPDTAITRTTADPLARDAQPAATPARHDPLPRRMVAVLSLPDGSELFMRESFTGWTIIEYATQPKRDVNAARRADLALLRDIAEAYGLAPPCTAAAPAAKRRALTLVCSR